MDNDWTRAIEAAAKVCENGHFLHDDAADARFGKACAAAIRDLPCPQPSGYVLVPVEPTEEMLTAGMVALVHADSPSVTDGQMALAYRSMLAARSGKGEA